MANILVVEDEPGILSQLSALLQRTKHSVATAADGSEAIKLLGLESGAAALPDVVILDIMMPNANGYAVVSKMQQSPLAKNVPIILLSGYTDLEEVFRKFKNVKAFLPKPFEPPALLNVLADVLAARRSTQPAAEA